VEAGLDGLEVVHSDHNGAATGEFSRLAERYRLLRSAGSDFHAPAEGGKSVGACRLGAENWDRLVGARPARREEAGRPPLRSSRADGQRHPSSRRALDLRIRTFVEKGFVT